MADLPMRALGMMQAIAEAYAGGQISWGPDRGIVTREAAVDAILSLFAVLDEPLQTGEPPSVDRLLHAMSMLMVIREYVLPLPLAEGAEELLQGDLRTLVEALAKAHDDFEPL